MSYNDTDQASKLAEQGPVLTAPVTEVTLMEDRARVLRRGSLKLAAGRHQVLVHAVAPVLVDKSLMVVTETSGGQFRVVDARVIREMVVRTESGANSADAHAELIDLRAERRALEKEIASAAAELKRCEDKGTGLRRTGSLTLNEIVSDVSWGKAVEESWSTQLAKLRGQHLESIDKWVLLNSQQEERQASLRSLDARIVLLQSPAEHEMARIAIDVECDALCDASFAIDYVVPGACWRPYHRAHLQGVEEDRIVFKTDACIWQNTGEDWLDAQLILSTERPSLGATAPALVTDFLSLRRKTEAVHIEARDEAVESLQDEDGTAKATSSHLPGIDDGGSALSIRLPRPASVRSDGRPHRLLLSEFEASASCALVATPELNPCVVLVASLENTGEAPLLAGPVDLIRKSGIVGQSKILYVASGERFDLGFGPEPDLRIHREVESSSETSRALSSWSVKSHLTRLRLSNIGQQSYALRISERIPVSEIDKVKIEVDLAKTTGKQQADKNGFLNWNLQLGAMSNATIELHYRIKMHDDVQS